MPAKRFVATLTSDERAQLEALSRSVKRTVVDLVLVKA